LLNTSEKVTITKVLTFESDCHFFTAATPLQPCYS